MISSDSLFEKYFLRTNYHQYTRRRGIVLHRGDLKKYKNYYYYTDLIKDKYKKTFELDSNFNTPLYKEIYTDEGVHIYYVDRIVVWFKYNHQYNNQFLRNLYKEKYGSDEMYNDEMYYEINLSVRAKFIDHNNQTIEHSNLKEKEKIGFSTFRNYKIFKLTAGNIFSLSEKQFNDYIENLDVNKKEFNLLDFINNEKK